MKYGARDLRPLLARIMDTPHLAQVVPRLHHGVLHRVIERCGLEDCGELVALATPDQLAGVLDIDLWRSNQPGLDEQFSADRFGVWLEVLAESEAGITARTLARMDVALVAAALARYVLVCDPAVASPSSEMDGEEVVVDRAPDAGLAWQVGGYQVVARRPDAWDAIVAALVSLDAECPDYFHRLMRGCRRLSNSTPEVDGLDNLLTDPEQVMFDLTSERERRREGQGYATPAEARTFLQMSRELRIDHESMPSMNPVSIAYFRGVDEAMAADASDLVARLPAADPPPTPEASASAVAALIDVLIDEGVLPQPPRALLGGRQGPAPRLARMQTHLQFVHDHDPAAYSIRSQELAFLANTIKAGCAIQARSFTTQEAADAAIAACNLGLENWPPHWSAASSCPGSSAVEAVALPQDFLVDHDLVRVFQVGWSVLHAQVCIFAAEGLISVLTSLRCHDREIQAGLVALRTQMAKQWQAGAPWRAREALDVIASLDMPAWAALLGLIDECPVIHASIGASRGAQVLAISATAFEFIAENSQIASVGDYLQSLPATLRG